MQTVDLYDTLDTPAIIILPLRLADRVNSSLKVECMHESSFTPKWPTKFLSNYPAEEITAHQSTDKPTKWLRNPQTENFTDLLFNRATDRFTSRLVYNYLSCSWKSTSIHPFPIWKSGCTVSHKFTLKMAFHNSLFPGSHPNNSCLHAIRKTQRFQPISLYIRIFAAANEGQYTSYDFAHVCVSGISETLAHDSSLLSNKNEEIKPCAWLFAAT